MFLIRDIGHSYNRNSLTWWPWMSVQGQDRNNRLEKQGEIWHKCDGKITRSTSAQFASVRHYSGRVASSMSLPEKNSCGCSRQHPNAINYISPAGFINYVLASCQATLSHRKQLHCHLASFCHNNTLSTCNQLRHLLTYFTATDRRAIVGADVLHRPETITRYRRYTNEYGIRTSLSY